MDTLGRAVAEFVQMRFGELPVAAFRRRDARMWPRIDRAIWEQSGGRSRVGPADGRVQQSVCRLLASDRRAVRPAWRGRRRVSRGGG
ncbi:MAG: hypothetical protein D6725_15900, partial [Planctomycetota bacterium]